jgi:uncharacterized protein
MDMTLDEKYALLLSGIRGCGSAAVAFSGGVDSSLLCHAAAEALGARALAVTVVSPFLPASELQSAKETAAAIGIEHILVQERDIDEETAANTKERCYFCKKREFGAILDAVRERGIRTVLEGSNADDETDYRPGLRAVAELGIKSPLREAALGKRELRELARRFGLPSWNKPAASCLASRIPYGDRIDERVLRRVEQAEDFLRAKGFRQFRVRSHGDIARIEVERNERPLFFNETLLDEISSSLKAAGFLYVSFELEGYRMGSLNRALRG